MIFTERVLGMKQNELFPLIIVKFFAFHSIEIAASEVALTCYFTVRRVHRKIAVDDVMWETECCYPWSKQAYQNQLKSMLNMI